MVISVDEIFKDELHFTKKYNCLDVEMASIRKIRDMIRKQKTEYDESRRMRVNVDFIDYIGLVSNPQR